MLIKSIIYNKFTLITLLLSILLTHSSFHFEFPDNAKTWETSDKAWDSYVEEDEVLANLLENYISQKLKDNACPGLALSIIKNDKVIYNQTFGVKNMLTKQPIDDCTIFRIGSLSKGFAGVLAGILSEKGLINLDAPISQYVPDITLSSSDPAQPITVRHILSHTSGYSTHTYSDLIDNNYSRENIYKKLGTIQPHYKTGNHFAYQNAIFGIIEAVVESVTQLSYPEALEKYILKPLDMNETSYTYDGIINTDNYCVGHKQYNKQKTIKALTIGKHYYNMVSAGGINAPLSDMTKWLIACMGHKPDVISNEVRRAVFTPNVNTTRDKKYFNKWPSLIHSYYGLGWRNLETEKNYLIHHGGLVNGFRSEIAFDAMKQIGAVFMFNSTCPYANECIEDFFEIWNDYNDPSFMRNITGF